MGANNGTLGDEEPEAADEASEDAEVAAATNPVPEGPSVGEGANEVPVSSKKGKTKKKTTPEPAIEEDSEYFDVSAVAESAPTEPTVNEDAGDVLVSEKKGFKLGIGFRPGMKETSEAIEEDSEYVEVLAGSASATEPEAAVEDSKYVDVAPEPKPIEEVFDGFEEPMSSRRRRSAAPTPSA